MLKAQCLTSAGASIASVKKLVEPRTHFCNLENHIIRQFFLLQPNKSVLTTITPEMHYNHIYPTEKSGHLVERIVNLSRQMKTTFEIQKVME